MLHQHQINPVNRYVPGPCLSHSKWSCSFVFISGNCLQGTRVMRSYWLKSLHDANPYIDQSWIEFALESHSVQKKYLKELLMHRYSLHTVNYILQTPQASHNVNLERCNNISEPNRHKGNLLSNVRYTCSKRTKDKRNDKDSFIGPAQHRDLSNTSSNVP